MKLPKYFNIFGQKVWIVIKHLGNAAGMYEHGQKKKLIYLSPEHETDDELLDTVLHECGHALFYRVSINQGVPYEVHEFIVSNYATMLRENFDIKPKIRK